MTSLKYCFHRLSGTQAADAAVDTASTSSDAGNSRLARLAQNFPTRSRPVSITSRKRCEVIKKPLMTKKTSTPI